MHHGFLLIIFICLTLNLFAFEPFDDSGFWGTQNDREGNLIRDLLIVEVINKRLNERFPVTYNHFLQGGYLNMPSARMGEEGEIGIGYAWVHPYRIYNARIQVFRNIEVSGNYRVFSGIEDPVLGRFGFGEFSDKGANLKIALWLPEDSKYVLPGVSIGFDDTMGTRAFKSQYVVATQVFVNYDFEVSLGYGAQRLRRWFGGISWMPWRKSENPYIKGVSFVAEYDATDYKHARHEPHPHGRKQSSPVNLGIKYRLWDYFDFSASWIRGREFAFSASTFYNLGETSGLVPKIETSLPYCAPVVTQPLGSLRPEDVMIQDFIFAFKEQGFDLIEGWLSYDKCGSKVLRLTIYNPIYIWEWDVRSRFNHILACLTPSDVDRVIVVLECEGFPIQEYRYEMAFVREFAAKEMGEWELNLLTPECEVSYPNPCTSHLIFKKSLPQICYELLPRTQTYFGSSKGKFKYAFGVSPTISGFLKYDIFYQIQLGITFFSDLEGLGGIDRLNPSQLINVHTDIVNYYKQKTLQLEKATLQKNWNMGNGFYSRLAGGYFDIAYGGVGLEFLYYPANSCWAIGIEGDFLAKRKYHGLGFTTRIRKYHGFYPTHVKFYGSQCFLDLYYAWMDAQLDFKVSIGKFLANDFGSRFEITRNFDSGLRVTVWYTITNARDKINGQIYHDKGVALSMPLDIFYTHCTRDRFGYGISAWLRDCGFRTTTGKRLYDMIHDERQ